jgi:hypothetical protein
LQKRGQLQLRKARPAAQRHKKTSANANGAIGTRDVTKAPHCSKVARPKVEISASHNVLFEYFVLSRVSCHFYGLFTQALESYKSKLQKNIQQ